MTAPRCARTIYDDQVDQELSRWPGVTFSREVRGKHYAIVLTFAGQSRFVVYPCSPGDALRGQLNHIRDVRGVLRALGAKRSPERKSSHQRRARNRTEPSRIIIADRATGGPRRDPWAPLARLAEEWRVEG